MATARKAIAKRIPIKKTVLQNSSCTIKEIFVEKLFGYYTYKIPADNAKDYSKLLILYGDNGSGKTTILKSIYYLISAKDGKGHKSILAKTKFKKIYVKLSNSIEIGAQRKTSSEGSFEYYIKENGKKILFVNLESNQEKIINLEEESKEKKSLYEIYQYIKKIDISIFYLADDRKNIDKNFDSESSEQVQQFYIVDGAIKRRKKRNPGFELGIAVDKFHDWIRSKVIQGSNEGAKTTQTIYIDLIKTLSHSNNRTSESVSKEQLISEIDSLHKKSSAFSKLGLINQFEYAEIKSILTKVRDSDKISLIYNTLKPFFDSLNSRLSALEDLQTILLSFIESVNSYLTRKKIHFDLSEGFEIRQENGDPIEFSLLSSGEKQLLLLLIHTITAANEVSIFIIDEPEISLNVKWQRNLLETLLAFNKENVQFVIATHSIELLSTNIDNVVKLEEK